MSDKINFSEKITDNLTSIISSLIENFQILLRGELDKKFEEISAELTQITEKYEKLDKTVNELIGAQNYFKTKIDELSAASESNLNNIEKIIQSEFADKMDNRFKIFHEEMEKIIDMNAALTVELSNRLDEMIEKINILSAIENKQQDMINELEAKIKSQVEKTSAVFESRLDGLRKQIEDQITPAISSIPNIQEKLNQLNKILNELTSKIAVLTDISKPVEDQTVND